MTVAVCLLLYSLVVAVFGPRLLVRLTPTGVAPRLGVAAWLMAIGSVAVSWIVAAVALTVEVLHSWGRPGMLLNACVTTLRDVATGETGVLLQYGMLALTALAAVAVACMTWRWSRSVLRARTHTHRHARAARMIGRRLPGLDAVVLDAPERVAYCVAGRPHTIVITSGALQALDDDHLGAVLAHERAHLTGRHHLLLAATRGLAATLPGIELITTGAAEIARLLEMCADDSAARRYGPRTVLGALIALSGTAPIPAGALGATGLGVLARAERLAEPPRPTQRARMRLLLGALVLLLLTGPVLTSLLAARDIASCVPWVT